MKTPTIFLHGFSGEGSSLMPFAEAYSGENFICLNMPGFGGSPVPGGDNHDIRTYSEAVWQEIRRQVPKGQVRLVGHSHGTMVGFVLALTHPDDVQRLDLFCPIASPRPVPNLSIRTINFFRRLLTSHFVIRLLTWQLLVDMVTRYSLRREWTPETRRRIIEMRRRESKYYSPVIFDLMAQTQRFTKQFAGVHATVPTRICYTTDDNVSGKKDHEWYAAHANTEIVTPITGGPLCVVADPVRVVELFGKED